ncbi:MAG: exodeoxyribonuclease VII small subunit [Oligoflexia bacterium]|nr:exodeoxyribonuclease VII small subunit [Oligoflexia bacterium]
MLDFETSLGELEKIVKEFESEKISLQEGLEKFERGVHLYKQCKSALSEAEKKVKILTDSLKEEDYTSPDQHEQE